MSDSNRKSNKKFLKRFLKHVFFKKLKPYRESNEYQPYNFNKKSSKITEKKNIPNNPDTVLSFVYS